MQAVGDGATVAILGEGNEASAATISTVTPAPDPRDGLFTVEVMPSGPAGAGLALGALVRVRFDPRAAPDGVRVPIDALVHRRGKTFVVGLDTQTRAREREVQVQSYSGSSAVVRSGVSRGDRIVAEGGDFLVDGTLVRVLGQGSHP